MIYSEDNYGRLVIDFNNSCSPESKPLEFIEMMWMLVHCMIEEQPENEWCIKKGFEILRASIGTEQSIRQTLAREDGSNPFRKGMEAAIKVVREKDKELAKMLEYTADYTC